MARVALGRLAAGVILCAGVIGVSLSLRRTGDLRRTGVYGDAGLIHAANKRLASSLTGGFLDPEKLSMFAPGSCWG